VDYTVIIPAYNASAYIAETLDSILAQEDHPQKIIVIDDGSTDTTAEIVQRYKHPVHYLYQENGGQGLARKTAIESSNTEWIALCDSDDLWNKDHIKKRINLLTAFPDADFTFSDCYSFGENADVTHTLLSEAPEGWLDKWSKKSLGHLIQINEPYAAFLEFNPAYLSGILFRRSAYDKVGGFKEKYSRWMAEDSEFVRRFIAQENICAIYDTDCTWGYRRHPDNYSSVEWKNYYGKAKILQEHLSVGVVPDPLIKMTEANIVMSLGEAFDIAYWKRDSNAAQKIFKELPLQAKTPKRLMRALHSVFF